MIAGEEQPVLDAARNDASPELRQQAINLLGVMGATDDLEGLYAAEKSVDVRESILHAFMVAGHAGPVLAAARGEADPELREAAVHQLGVMGATAELEQMFETEKSTEVREAILHSLFIAGDGAFLGRVAENNADPALRAAAIHSLGLVGGTESAATLERLYTSERDREVREQVLQALFVQQNVKALLRIARTEKDPDMKAAAVRLLSMMNSEEALDFMMELLDD